MSLVRNFHNSQRRIIQPTFHPNQIKTYGEIMITSAHVCLQQWKDGSTLDIHKEMMHVTLAIISKSVLGSDIKSQEKLVMHF